MKSRAPTAYVLFSIVSFVVPASIVVASFASCSPKPSGEDIRIVGPNSQDFTSPCLVLEGGTDQTCGVSAMLERRCGSLDCHGHVRRPLRIYSKNGLRLPPPLDVDLDAAVILEPGLGETTPEERSANYRAAIGLEPEQTDNVSRGEADPDSLLLYKKPLGLEHHKGGVAINKGDDSETCLVSWLKGETDRVACGKAAALP